MSFAFKPDEAWEPGAGLLPAGDHVCEVLEITAGDLNSSGGTSGVPHPMIKVRTGNNSGSIYDNLVISSPNTFGKFTALVLACGIPESEFPKPGVDFDVDNGRVTQEYANKLLGRKVGTIVREQPDKRPDHRGEMRPEVMGYRPANTITDDIPADTRGLPQVQPASSSRPANEAASKIPF